jgi:uncharacterized iron-regulated membrane protein
MIDRYGQSSVQFRDGSGELANLSLPTGQSSRTTIDNWFTALHIGHVFGLPHRLLVSAMELLVTMLSMTGVILWTRKRGTRAMRWFRARPQPEIRAEAA